MATYWPAQTPGLRCICVHGNNQSLFFSCTSETDCSLKGICNYTDTMKSLGDATILTYHHKLLVLASQKSWETMTCWRHCYRAETPFQTCAGEVKTNPWLFFPCLCSVVPSKERRNWNSDVCKERIQWKKCLRNSQPNVKTQQEHNSEVQLFDLQWLCETQECEIKTSFDSSSQGSKTNKGKWEKWRGTQERNKSSSSGLEAICCKGFLFNPSEIWASL